jgi:phosphatidate phosphatase PAH1
MAAFHREVIEKKPEDFKIACLKDIQVRIAFAFLHHRTGTPFILKVFVNNREQKLK